MEKSKQILLIILDGWGYREDPNNNAIAAARTPFWDSLWETYPHTLLAASGEAVGLPPGQMGNSEVGHPVIGAGRVIEHDLVRINKAMTAGEFAANAAFQKLFAHVRKNNSTLHILGLVSPGGVHSHQAHLHEFLRVAKTAGLTKIAIHAFTDGRDTAPQSGHQYLEELEQVIADLGIGFIATASGRFYGMDRDNNWERIAQAEQAISRGQGKTHKNRRPSELLRELYQQGIVDEHLEPMVFLDDTGKSYAIEPHDGVLFFNFRPDRMRQLAQKLSGRAGKQNLCLVTMTKYDKSGEPINAEAAFSPLTIETTLARELGKAGLTQAHIGETEKYAHVTYFFNNGTDEKQPGEEHILVASRKDVRTHDQAPEMRAAEIVDKTLEQVARSTDFIVINLANADMVGHTGNYEATVQALEFLDKQIERAVKAMLARGGTILITADHGNGEINVHDTGEPHTAHTTSPVPAILVSEGGPRYQLRDNGTLADIAPTILALFSLPEPPSMTGNPLIIPHNP